MSKINLTDLSTITGNEQSAINVINANNAAIETASDNTVSRDGTSPNTMLADFDMNSFRILNCVDAVNLSEPATYRQVLDLVEDMTDGGAPNSASYLTLGTNSVLTNERVLTAGTNVSFVDAGAGSTLTINASGGGGSGDVVGPASATDGAVVLYNGTTGKLIKNSAVTVLSGSNTGDQTITLTGDVTGTGTGSFATTVANDAVSFAKMQNIATDSLIGRDTAATGDPENILLNATLSMDGSGNLRRAALTGDVTASAGSNATTIANDAVTTAKILNANVTLAKLANIATDSLIGRDTAASGVPENILLNATLSMDGSGNLQRAALTGDVTASAGSNATTIANDAVTYAKMQNVSATSRILGRKTASAGDTEECTLSEVLDFVGSAAQGDILFRGAASWSRLAAGTSGQLLKTNGTGADPAWITSSSSGREVLLANRTYYVRTDGSDSNTGLVNNAGGAFLTIQKAIDVTAALDCSIYAVTIQIADGTYTGAVTLKKIVGSSRVTITGNTGTPTNVILSVTSNNAVTASDVGAWKIEGVKFATITSGVGVYASGSTDLQLGTNDFGTVAGAHHINAVNSARITFTANYSISGQTTFSHIASVFFGYILFYSIAVTVSANVTFTYFAYATGLSAIDSGSTTYSLGIFTVTATRYRSDNNSYILTNSGGINYFPGTTAGSTASGGVYV